VSAFLAAAYPWLKALHIAFVIAWMAGRLYLPRLFVYHAAAPPGSETSQIFKIMERRLLYGIMMPAMLMTVLFGVLLAATPGAVDWRRGWIWAKLLLVLALLVYQWALACWRRAFAADSNRHTARFFRLVNELPAAAMLLIVILVVVKPF
jgi:protoporphyrinogen IX oxidase